MAERQDIAYLNDVSDVATAPANAVYDNIAIFGNNRALRDSGKKVSDFVQQSGVDAAVQQATTEIWNAVNGIYAIASYSSSSWSASTAYSSGSYCQYNNQGYRCTTAHTSGSVFDPAKWRLVLTAAGKLALAALLSAYSKDGLAGLIDLAPSYNASSDYSVGQLVIKDSVLQVCTTGGHGYSAIFSRNTTVESSIRSRLSTLAGTIPTKVSQLTNDSEFITEDDIPENVSAFANDSKYVASSTIDSEFNTTSAGYAVGDTCTKDAKFYKCIRTVAQGAAWNALDWQEKTLKEIASLWVVQTNADWEEDDPASPAYIENKPDIPEEVEIDDTLSVEGAAADAKAVGDALSGVISPDNIPFKISNVVGSQGLDPSKIEFQLIDRTVNVLSGTIASGKTIVLKPPAQPSSSVAGTVLARDFIVVMNLTTYEDVSVSVQSSSIKDDVGSSVVLKVPYGKMPAFRLTDSDRNSSIFIISGFYDAAHMAVSEIERALDAILLDSGAGTFTPGVYLVDEQDKYHKISIVTDAVTGAANIGIEQEGIIR